MGAPDPNVVHPMPGAERVVLLKAVVTSPLIDVGDYSYYDDPRDPAGFETNNVLYHYGPERLRIGKYCALGEGTTFIMNGANHRMDGPSTFPFPIMGGAWAEHFDLITGLPGRGDTVVGNDVWFGYRSLVMPGVTIGDGAIIASGAVVVDDVPPYGIVGGNPAKLIRRRFSDADVDRLLRIAWWNWPIEMITEHVRTIWAGTPAELDQVAERAGLLELTPDRVRRHITH
jgi:virginiamycin A acetyltransferase